MIIELWLLIVCHLAPDLTTGVWPDGASIAQDDAVYA